ncbi:dUTP diphosphatase [Staphylococcus warneri]|uniref:dUTP diphosphatase n=1 Tax=Staphylococcus warneri TaxID=1292 RepID=UPI0031DAA68F
MPTRDRLDAGYDIYSAETVILDPQEKAVIKTDVAVNIPEGYVGLLTSRSGISSKTHLVVTLGVIDAGYQGNLGINIKNDSQDWYGVKHSRELLDIKNNDISGSGVYAPFQKEYQINKGDKLAQLVIVPIWTPELKQVDEFHTESERGKNGFGSTGY